MSDETFRPQRKPIVHEQVETSDPIPPHFNPNPGVPNQGPPQGEMPPLQITGNMPPEFARMLNQANQGNQEQVPPVNRPMPSNPLMRATGSDKLEQLLNGINANHVVYHEVELPSKGKFYNGQDGPTNGILHIRPMTGAEESILASPNKVKRGKAMDDIFNQCIQERYASENLLTVDRTYLFLYLRGISFDVYYDVEIKCPECETKFNNSVNLDTLNLEECPEDFSPDKLTDVLPRTGYNFKYRLPAGADEQKVQDYRQRKLKNFDVGDNADDTILFRTALLLDNIEGLTDKVELLILLKKLPIEDTNYLRNVITEPPFGVDTKIPMECPSCNAEFNMELPLEANFFFPKNKKEVPIRQ